MAESIFKKTLGDLAASLGVSEQRILDEMGALHLRLPRHEKTGEKTFATRGQLHAIVVSNLTPDLKPFASHFTDALVAHVGAAHGAGADLGVDQEFPKV